MFGALEPLIVFPSPAGDGIYQIVSGNRRLKAAEQVGLTEVPCTIIDPIELDEARVSAHKEQRIKQPSDIIRELRILEEEFGLRQGVRSQDEKIQKARAYRDNLVKEHKKSNIDRLRQYDKKVRELVGEVYTEDGEYIIYFENQAGCDSVVTLKLDFEYVGVNDYEVDKGWVVYPNPAENRISIALDSDDDAGCVTVHNQLGQEVWTDFVSGTYTLDVSDWPRGFYVFHYSGDRIRQRFSVILD